MNRKALIFVLIALSTVSLYTMDEEQKTKSLGDAFEPETDFFDDTVNDAYKSIIKKMAEKSKSNQSRNQTQFYKELSATDLRKLCENQTVTEKAKEYWSTIIAEEKIHSAYHTACSAYNINESKENRAHQFTTFKRVGTEKLQSLASQEVSTIFAIQAKKFYVHFCSD